MDFDESSVKVVTQEFTAIVLAGFGTDLVPLTSNQGEEPCPKALLPIANKPMLDYPLSWLESSGIRDVLLICPSPHKAAISHYIHSGSSISSFPSLRIDLQVYDESLESGDGTCDVLRHFAHRLTGDFVLLPCDFVPSPSFNLSRVLDKFRGEANYDGAIATAAFYETAKTDKSAIIEEWGVPPPQLPVVWDDRTGTLLHVDTEDDRDRNGEELELTMSLLTRYPRAKMSASLQDAHVYVCKRSVLDILQEKSDFDSFREEFIPWLCKPQYSSRKRAKYANILNPPANTSTHHMSLEHSTTYIPSHTHSVREHLREDIRTATSSPVDLTERDESVSLRVGIVIHRSSEGYAARVNTLQNFLDLNRHFLNQVSWTLPTDSESRALIDPKAQISSDSMIGYTTKVSEKTSIKKSVIGKHCVIGKMVKIVGCVILDHCVIEDGAKLDGCILGTNTKVGAKAELSRCVTQAGYEVEAGESFKNEKLDVSDWTVHQGGSDDTGDEDAAGDESE
ncbi:uncharacterized protein PHACADRAFT_174871 [Phanerochaete carnosa HHB-10118-sp]|uniref:Translation initiation factor eIF2B subunit gamma n=1 Tax=Phanerochaete carnosa (strain HHB-10118-sp) TaxID=650164 RepID=K5UWG9_PHACS|nr:uncharacterized protein PHACADRAFT_174871 [Phanerochaete carnosa HHB-10118-sp]EKM54376.1 hypothetical protein PHACADRAFT_174871 [Phanerochaete carnosa HHB-10118-sp]